MADQNRVHVDSRDENWAEYEEYLDGVAMEELPEAEEMEELDDDDLYEDDGQPTEYEEYQDYMGGDDWDQGQYDE